MTDVALHRILNTNYRAKNCEAFNKAYMVGHQLVIYLANYNNNLTLQMYFNGSTNCYLGEVMMVPKLLLRIQGVHLHPP